MDKQNKNQIWKYVKTFDDYSGITWKSSKEDMIQFIVDEEQKEYEQELQNQLRIGIFNNVIPTQVA